MPTVIVDGVHIHFEESGAAVPVLLLNGLGSRGIHWRCQRRALEGRYRVITLDHRGIGWSSVPDEPAHRIPRMAEDAVAVLDHLRIERAHLVGASMGSPVAQEMALRHRERVRSLTLACSWAHADARLSYIFGSWAATAHRMPIEDWYRWVFLPLVVSPAFLADPARVDWLINRVFSTLPALKSETIERQARGMIEWTGSRVDDLSEIVAPALVLAGEDDIFTPPRLSQALAGALPHARFERLPGGHCFIAEQSRLFNAVLVDFLDGLRELA